MIYGFNLIKLNRKQSWLQQKSRDPSRIPLETIWMLQGRSALPSLVPSVVPPVGSPMFTSPSAAHIQSAKQEGSFQGLCVCVCVHAFDCNLRVTFHSRGTFLTWLLRLTTACTMRADRVEVFPMCSSANVLSFFTSGHDKDCWHPSP